MLIFVYVTLFPRFNFPVNLYTVQSARLSRKAKKRKKNVRESTSAYEHDYFREKKLLRITLEFTLPTVITLLARPEKSLHS